MGKKNFHVVPHDDKGWAVRKEGSKKVSSTHTTQDDAIQQGKEWAQKDQAELVIHRKDGRIRDKDSYGNDPCPPKDTKH